MVLAWQTSYKSAPDVAIWGSGQLINKPEEEKKRKKKEESREWSQVENVLHGYGENRGCDAKVLFAASRVR